MRLLVLGGTRFLGRAIVDEAIRRGYDVTTFSRGLSGEPRPGAEALHGDRTSFDDLLRLANREFDAVIDTSVIAPEQSVPPPGCSRTMWVTTPTSPPSRSTGTIHANRSPRVHLSSTARPMPRHRGNPRVRGTQGRIRTGRRRRAARPKPPRPSRARSWAAREYRAAALVAGETGPGRDRHRPGGASPAGCLTDARDLASWLVDNTRRGIPGTVNVPGSEGTVRRTARRLRRHHRGGPHGPGHAAVGGRWGAAGGGRRAVDGIAHVAPDIPELAGTWQVSGDRAVRTGMRYRPLADIVHDTWLWLRGTPRPAAVRSTSSSAALASALTPPRSRPSSRPSNPPSDSAQRLRPVTPPDDSAR